MGKRSRNPDLIFNDIRETRAQKVVSCFYENPSPEPPELDRATVFVTHACNFFCAFCNGPHMPGMTPLEVRNEMLRREMTPLRFDRLIADWKRHGLGHIHFTGGEATINPDLSGFIQQASQQGVLSSLTTNGSADPALYRELVENGLTEIRISLASTSAAEFDALVKRAGAFEKVLRAIRELVRLRDEEEKNIFIIINVCLQNFEEEECQRKLLDVLKLRPDDVKLLVIAESARQIESRASRRAVDSLLRLIRQKNPEGYELLEQKVRNLFRKNLFGLREMEAQYLMRRCHVALTERTVDATGVYPCSIYLRYRGEPVALVTAPFLEQQEAINAFVEHHDCKSDPICSANCTKCCREFNIDVNLRLKALEQARTLESHPVIEGGEVSDCEAVNVLSKFTEIQATPFKGVFPFFIIKPVGLQNRAEIISYLRDQDVSISHCLEIENWADFSQFLYLKKEDCCDLERLKFKIAMNRGFRSFERTRALFMRIENFVPVKKIYRIKSDLRKWFGEEKRVMRLGAMNLTLSSNAIHAPDLNDLLWGNRVINYFYRGW